MEPNARPVKAPAKILIVDDNLDFSGALKMYLESQEFRIFDAANSWDALALCARERPDLLILDIYLNGELGLDVARTIAGDPGFYGKPIVIAVSGTVGGALVHSLEYLRENNIDDFVKKPLDMKTVLERIHRHLGMSDFRAP
jgi:DNA-binding response OmpR family regulator